jgi:hypothetical protein
MINDDRNLNLELPSVCGGSLGCGRGMWMDHQPAYPLVGMLTGQSFQQRLIGVGNWAVDGYKHQDNGSGRLVTERGMSFPGNIRELPVLLRRRCLAHCRHQIQKASRHNEDSSKNNLAHAGITFRVVWTHWLLSFRGRCVLGHRHIAESQFARQ